VGPPLSRVWAGDLAARPYQEQLRRIPAKFALQDALHILRLVNPAQALRILDRVRATPPGFVRTYGDVSPGAPRVAGAVLHDCHDPDVPWHRIVRADGSLAKGDRQRALLEAEGVPFRRGRVDMRIARVPEL
jgi:methylated-DNA-protein-cysteine methyltransferase-like protein